MKNLLLIAILTLAAPLAWAQSTNATPPDIDPSFTNQEASTVFTRSHFETNSTITDDYQPPFTEFKFYSITNDDGSLSVNTQGQARTERRRVLMPGHPLTTHTNTVIVYRVDEAELPWEGHVIVFSNSIPISTNKSTGEMRWMPRQ